MPVARDYELEASFKDSFSIHAREGSIASSSGRSSSSAESTYQSVPAIHPPAQPTRKKSNSLSRIFGVKEPSLSAFEQMAELQQKELAQKNQKIPFGVPNAKVPQSARDDYKRAKQRAKESAKMHELIKEKMRQQSDYERRRHEGQSPVRAFITRDEEQYMSADADAASVVPSHNATRRFRASAPESTPRLRHPPSHEYMPNMPSVAAMASERSPTATPPTPPLSHHPAAPPSAKISGVLQGRARKEALPWE